MKARGSGVIAYRRTWLSPGLTSGQLLDRGIASRQSTSRKNIKKAAQPFALLFRSTYQCSTYSPPALGKRGILSAHDASRLMTDPNARWGAPWAVKGPESAGQTRKRRHDAIAPSVAVFGEDELDRVIDRLVEVRFLWDREDGVVATGLVPASLFAATEHCEPYSPAYEERHRRPSRSGAAAGEEDGETILVGSTRVRLKPPTERSGHPKSVFHRPQWGFTGVDTVPTVVLDAARGPLLSSSSEPLLSPRWSAASRSTTSVMETRRLRRGIAAASIVGLPPRSAFLLLKSVATTELEDPALDVALLIAMGEHYNGYQPTECLELLRCARRLALMRALRAPAPGRASARLYEDASLAQDALGDFTQEVAPFLAAKVWARLPEHSARLLRRGYALDWFDLLSLAVETSGAGCLPDGLPSAASAAPYASKYLFFRYTLGLDEATVSKLVARLRPNGVHAVVPLPPSSSAGTDVTMFASDEGELQVKPLVLWTCAALLARLVAESLGDVLRHVGRSLAHHAALADEVAETTTARQRGAAAAPPDDGGADLNEYLDRLALRRPQVAGARPPQDRMRPRKMRVRLLPFEAFPNVIRCLPVPARAATEHATRLEQERRRQRQQVESPFASVMEESALVTKHVERATAALTWSTMVLTACVQLVAGLTLPAHPAGSMTFAAADVRVELAAQDARKPVGEARHHVGFEDGSVMAQREALCARFVQSKVQLLMDALVTKIPWKDVEERVEPLFPPAPRCSDSTAEAVNAPGAAGELDDLTAAALMDLLQPAPEDDRDAEPHLTEAEQRMRAALGDLQHAIEGFQLVVADMLDAQEDYFGAAAGDETATRTGAADP